LQLFNFVLLFNIKSYNAVGYPDAFILFLI
jgi:hypothetical protein